MENVLKSGLVLFLLGVSLLAFATESDQANDLLNPEEIVTIGQKIERAKTEISIETERLFGIAGAGEDPLQAILSLPGVTFDSNGEPVIRGSAPGDNSFYIDLVPASKLYHIWGNSIFNKYVIQNLDLHPAAFSSRFGNATGGVIDVGLRDPQNIPLTTTASLSLLQAAALFETGISENQSIYLSARRSTLDLLLSEDDLSDEEDGLILTEKPAASDYQMKYLWRVNDQNTLSIIAAGASDKVGGELTGRSNDVLVDPDLAGSLDYSEKFDSQGVNWAWQALDGRRSVNLLATHISEREEFFYGAEQFFKSDADINSLRADYQQSIFGEHEFKLGVISENSRYDIDARDKFVSCSDFDADCPTVDVQITNYKNKVKVNRSTAYVEGKFQLSENQSISAGLHYSKDDYLDAGRIEPRLRWTVQLNEHWNTYIAAGQYSQLPNLAEILPNIGNPNLDTIKADHFVWGINHSLTKNWNWKADLYYKNLTDVVISINDPANSNFGQNYSNEAEGIAYGAEFQLNKDRGDSPWDGWLAVSLGKAERTDLFKAETTPFDYDRPVKLDLVGNYHLGERWRFGVRWTYQTGDRYTPIVDVARNANDPNVLQPIYGIRNSYASPDYHRLDLRAEYKKPTSWGHWSVFMDIINVYGRENVSGYAFAPNQVDVLQTPPPGFGDNVPVQTSVSDGAIPSIGFEVRF